MPSITVTLPSVHSTGLSSAWPVRAFPATFHPSVAHSRAKPRRIKVRRTRSSRAVTGEACQTGPPTTLAG
jgi:hypothetical protein